MKCNGWRQRELVLAICFNLFTILTSSNSENISNSDNGSDSKVEFSAWFMNCKIPDAFDDAQARLFQRNEPLKYDVLRGCNKKIAIALKLMSHPEDSGVSNIPIEYVLDGPSSKRVRLLDPLVLRLRRDVPLQAYKLHHLYNVRVIFTGNENEEDMALVKKKSNRKRRDTESSGKCNGDLTSLKLDHDTPDHRSYSINLNDIEDETSAIITANKNNDKGKATPSKRYKRHEYNVIVEESPDDFSSIDSSKNLETIYNKTAYNANFLDTKDAISLNQYHKINNNYAYNEVSNSDLSYPPFVDDVVGIDTKKEQETVDFQKNKNTLSQNSDNNLEGDSDYDSVKGATKSKQNEEMYSLYDVKDPELWHSLNLQLLQKSTDPNGKTVWYDVTAGEDINVGTQYADWMNEDVAIRYRSANWLNRSQFVLPSNSISVLNKLKGPSHDTDSNGLLTYEYLVVPKEDILHVDERSKNSYDDDKSELEETSNEKKSQKVVVNLKRALNTDYKNRLNVVLHDSDMYLTVPHAKMLQALVDIEARADDNDLIRVGSSARISTVVADSTRQARSIITLHATNTGLAASQFRAKVSDCGIQLSNLLSNGRNHVATTTPVLIPPRHTKRMVLELPVELPTDKVHCNVALVNNDEETVAVRDVTLQSMDRCFCVWHCDCVCLGLDPKLMCSEMTPSKLIAAGIAPHERPRREVCAPGEVVCPLHLLTLVTAIFLFLLCLGVIKACLGLVIKSIGIMGLEQVVKLPRHMDHYHEPWLRMRRVICDSSGWPLHPDTKKRSVRVMGMCKEFCLNICFFLILPFLIVRDGMKKLVCCPKSGHRNKTSAKGYSKIHVGRKPDAKLQNERQHSRKSKVKERLSKNERLDSKKSEHRQRKQEKLDANRRKSIWLRMARRRRELLPWMTPAAEEMSQAVWQPTKCEPPCPVKVKVGPCCSCDSEREEAEYIRKKMDQSRECLAKCSPPPMCRPECRPPCRKLIITKDSRCGILVNSSKDTTRNISEN